MPTTSRQPHQAQLALIWIVALTAAWIMPGLLGHDPWKPDEAHYLGLVYSLIQGGDWIVPTLAGEHFVEKPPLYYWSAALVAKLLAPPLALHDAARLTSGLYIALMFAFIAGAARELYGNGRGRVAVLLMIGCLGLALPAHQLITDTALLAGVAAAFYGLALGLRRPAAGGFWFGTGVGIAFMAKGLLAPGIFLFVALLLPLTPAWYNRRYAATLAVAALAALPWLVLWPYALYAKSPALFDEWLMVNNVGRFLGINDLGPTAQPGQYLRMLPWYALPALPLAGWALWRMRKNLAAPQVVLPLCGFIVILLTLSVSAQARELYALPMLVPLALLATPSIDTLRRGAANLIYWFSLMTGGFCMIVAWFYWCALELAVPAKLHAHLHTLQPGYTPGFKWLPFALGAAYSIGWIYYLLQLRKNRERPVMAWAASMTMVWGLLAFLFVGVLDAGKSYRSMIVDLQKSIPVQYDCIASQNLGEPQRAMLHYFAGITTYRFEEPSRRRACQLTLVQGWAEFEKPPLAPGRWEKIWEGTRPGDKAERYRLYRRAGSHAANR